MSSNPGARQRVPEEFGKSLEDSLTSLVEHSTAHSGARADELAPSEMRSDAIHSHGEQSKGWIHHLWPSSQTVDNLFAGEHMGNYVIDRQTGKKNFESMPLYVRVGMHLLFVDGCGYMTSHNVEELLMNQSVKQGKTYDQTGPGVKEHIDSFIKTYSLPMGELLVQDLDQYPTFNSFFSRRLLPTARPITSPEDTSIVTSPADCRLTVFPSIDAAKQFWIKGKKFTVPTLLTGDPNPSSESPFAQFADAECGIMVCRLAPQDYHRFHSPVEATVGDVHDIKGELYTVNPQAINEDLNVFTLNKRSVMLLQANIGHKTVPMAFVAVGAMLVGSIGWSKKPGDKVAKGEELGWFQYGGSTCIVVFPKNAFQLDSDIVGNSEKTMETLVKVGMEVGKV